MGSRKLSRFSLQGICFKFYSYLRFFIKRWGLILIEIFGCLGVALL